MVIRIAYIFLSEIVGTMSIEENSRRVCKVYSSPYFFIPFPACKTSAIFIPVVESQRREREEEGARREEVHVPKRHRDRCVRGLRCRSFPPNHGHRRTSFDDGPRKGRKSPMNAPIRRAAPASWGPFCAPRDVCDPRVSCLRVSPTRLRPRFLPLSISLSFFSPPPSFPSSTCRSSFLRPPREHSKNWRRLLSSPLLFLPLSSRDAATNNALPRWSAAI